MNPMILVLSVYLFVLLHNLYKAFKTKEIGIAKEKISVKHRPAEFWFVVFLNILMSVVIAGLCYALMS